MEENNTTYRSLEAIQARKDYLLKDIKGAAGEIDPITYQDLFESVERNVSKESALQGKLQEIEGITGGRYKDNWQNLRFR